MLSEKQLLELEIFAANVRIRILEMISAAGKGHVGGSMSAADVAAVLYGHYMNVDPENPRWEERDRLVMSKGHSGCAIYAALLLRGFFPEDWAPTLNQLGTRLPSHCDRQKTPGIDMTTGSLGQGLSAASGIAYANELLGRKVFTYCILGDGECQEGQPWEAMMFAGHHKQGHLIAFVDMNGKQVDGVVDEILPVHNIGAHAELFGWHVQTINGNDIRALSEAIENARNQTDRPSMIIMKTIKGFGCFAQDLVFNHGIGVSQEQYESERIRLESHINELTFRILHLSENDGKEVLA